MNGVHKDSRFLARPREIYMVFYRRNRKVDFCRLFTVPFIFFSLIIKGWCLYVYQNKSNEEYNEI